MGNTQDMFVLSEYEGIQSVKWTYLNIFKTLKNVLKFFLNSRENRRVKFCTIGQLDFEIH